MSRTRRVRVEILRGAAGEVVRVKRGDGEWQQFGGVEDLPQDVCGLLADMVDRSGGVVDGGPKRRRRRSSISPVNGRELTLRTAWFDPVTFFFLLIATPAILYFTWDAISLGGTLSLWGWVLGVPFALFFTYYALASVINTTIIEIRDGLLTSRHVPLPWFHQQTIPSSDVAQLICEFRRTRRSAHWRVVLLTHAGRRVMLVEFLREEDEARRIERAIERHLGLEDWA